MIYSESKAKMNIQQLINGTVYLQAPLKAFELDSRILEEKYNLRVRQLDYNNESDLETWISIIHTSYDDCCFTIDSARDYLVNHPFLDETQTFVFQEVSGNHGRGGEVATVSIGLYKTNPRVGGDFRIGVTRPVQGLGYGRLCILYAFSQLAAMGVKYGESAIAFKRKESLYLHYALGFRPQTNLRFLANQSSNKFLKKRNIILKYRLIKSYKDFQRNERKHYLK